MPGKNHPHGPIGPVVSAGATLLTETAAAGSGAYTASAVVDVRAYRTITLFINSDAAAANGYPMIRPRVAFEDDGVVGVAPAFGSDVWYAVGVTDGAPVATLLTGAVASGVDYTGAPEWGVLTFRPLAIRTEAHDAATDEIRMTVALDVSAASWFSLEYGEVGNTGTPSALGIKYVLSN